MVLLAAVTALVLVVAAGPQELTSDSRAGLQSTNLEENSTISWRLEGWRVLVDRQWNGDTVDILLGLPAGTSQERVIAGLTVDVGAHSMYVTTFSLVGVTGLVTLILAHVRSLRSRRRPNESGERGDGRVALLFVTLVAAQLVFFIGYSLGALAGLVLGLACGFRSVPVASRRSTGPEGACLRCGATICDNSERCLGGEWATHEDDWRGQIAAGPQ
jgi:hypothetical protein